MSSEAWHEAAARAAEQVAASMESDLGMAFDDHTEAVVHAVVTEAFREFSEALRAHGAAERERIIEANRRIIKHELETPMRSHDEDGACCRAAAEGHPQMPKAAPTP